MAVTEIKVRMQQRRDTAAGWASANPVLLNGEIGCETNTGYRKLGDGSTAWNSLAYLPESKISAYPLNTSDIADDAITGDKLANDITIGNSMTVTGNMTVTTTEVGFFGSAGAVQSAHVADITATATTGTLPTADGIVTIADAASPTNAELLEYCVELEAKVNSLLAFARAHGLMALTDGAA